MSVRATPNHCCNPSQGIGTSGSSHWQLSPPGAGRQTEKEVFLSFPFFLLSINSLTEQLILKNFTGQYYKRTKRTDIHKPNSSSSGFSWASEQEVSFSVSVVPLQPSHAPQFLSCSLSVKRQVNGNFQSPFIAELWLYLAAVISEPSETIHQSPGDLPRCLWLYGSSFEHSYKISEAPVDHMPVSGLLFYIDLMTQTTSTWDQQVLLWRAGTHVQPLCGTNHHRSPLGHGFIRTWKNTF